MLTKRSLRMLSISTLSLAAAAVLSSQLVTVAKTADDTKVKKTYDKPPAMNLDLAKTYTATITTTKGKIVLELFAKDAPQTVNSFVFLSREGFYDGLIFHRVIPDFMIQGGDPTGTGSGGPGYQFANENHHTDHGFTPGTLAMANAGLDTNGSQFFITDTTAPLPADKYTIFGEVKEGLDVVKAIARVARGQRDRPNEPVVMEKIEIEEK